MAVNAVEKELEETRHSLRLSDADVQRIKIEHSNIKIAHENLLPKFDKAQVKKMQLKEELGKKLVELADAQEELNRVNLDLAEKKNTIAQMKRDT